MVRTARQKSESGIYHVMVRGINGQDIFLDGHDRGRYLKTLATIAEEYSCKVHGYCLMTNHVHILISEGLEPLGDTMKRVGVSYVYWYNLKYDRTGHLFQDRYRSEPVGDDRYFQTVLRYIHQNAVKAGLARSCQDYFWSSYRDYLGEKAGRVRVVDTCFSLSLMGGLPRFIEFMNADTTDICLDVEENRRVKDGVLTMMLLEMKNELGVENMQQLGRAQRDEVLRRLKAVDGASLRQIARVTGVGKMIVERA